MTTTGTWTATGTDEPLDQDIDFGVEGWWGGIGPDGREDTEAFSWFLYDHWLYEDGPPVAEGYAKSEKEAKDAVMAAWRVRRPKVDEDGRLMGYCRACDGTTGAADEDYCIDCQMNGRHL